MCLRGCGKEPALRLARHTEGSERSKTKFRQVEFDTDTRDCACAHRHSH